MKRDKKNMDEILKKHLSSASKEQVEAAKARALERLREERGEQIREFDKAAESGTSMPDIVGKLRELDEVVLTAVKMLGKGDFNGMLGIVNQLRMEPADLDDITMSLHRLDRAKKVSLRKLFPMDPPVAEESALDEETSKERNLGKEKA
jgi:hypothetical protein